MNWNCLFACVSIKSHVGIRLTLFVVARSLKPQIKIDEFGVENCVWKTIV